MLTWMVKSGLSALNAKNGTIPTAKLSREKTLKCAQSQHN